MQFGFILKNAHQKPIYDGDPYDLVFSVDPDLAKDYWKHVLESGRRGKLYVTCFDEQSEFSCLTIPVDPERLKDGHPDKDLIDVTERFFDGIQDLINRQEISTDRSVVWWKNFIRTHKVFIDPDDKHETPIFHQLEEKNYEVILSPSQKKLRSESRTQQTIVEAVPLPSAGNIRIPLPYDPADYLDRPETLSIPEYRALMYEKKKQVLDGFLRMTPLIHQGVDTPVGENIEYDEPSIMPDGSKSFVQIGGYSDTLRELGYGSGKMKRYHGRYLQNWQILSKIYLGWITCIVAPRRGGKTDMATLIIDEALFAEKADGNPMIIMWVGINKKKNKTARNYIRRKLKTLFNEGMVRWNQEEQSLSLIETIKNPNGKDGRGEYIDQVKSVIYFVGAGDEEAGVGDSADLIIVDEVERIDKTHPEVIDDLMAIVNNEQARIIFISTLNWKSQKTRFYDWLKKGEADEMKRNMNGESIYELIDEYRSKHRDVLENKDGLDTPELLHQISEIKLELMMRRQYVGIRFTGEDIDIWTDNQKKQAKEQAAAQNYDKYIAEWWGIFPNEVRALGNIERSFIEEDKVPDRYPLVIVSYDLANTGTDNKVVVGLGYCNDPDSPCYNSFVQFLEKELYGGIEQQLPQVIKLKNEIFARYSMEKGKKIFIYDGKGLGETVEILFRQAKVKVNGIIKNHNGPDHSEPRENIFYPSKTKAVEDVVDLATNGAFYLSKACTKTINELVIYEKVDNNSSVGYTYQAPKGKQDGHVSALIQGVYMGYHALGLKVPIMQGIAAKIVEFEEENEVKPAVNYYGPNGMRGNQADIKNKINQTMARFRNPKIRF